MSGLAKATESPKNPTTALSEWPDQRVPFRRPSRETLRCRSQNAQRRSQTGTCRVWPKQPNPPKTQQPPSASGQISVSPFGDLHANSCPRRAYARSTHWIFYFSQRITTTQASMVKDEIYVAARPRLTQKSGSIWRLSTPGSKSDSTTEHSTSADPVRLSWNHGPSQTRKWQ